MIFVYTINCYIYIEVIKKIYGYGFFLASLIPLIYIVSLVMLALPLIYINCKNIILGRYKNGKTVNDYYK